MFWKNRKGLPFFCCIAGALLLSLGMEFLKGNPRAGNPAEPYYTQETIFEAAWETETILGTEFDLYFEDETRYPEPMGQSWESEDDSEDETWPDESSLDTDFAGEPLDTQGDSEDETWPDENSLDTDFAGEPLDTEDNSEDDTWPDENSLDTDFAGEPLDTEDDSEAGTWFFGTVLESEMEYDPDGTEADSEEFIAPDEGEPSRNREIFLVIGSLLLLAGGILGGLFVFFLKQERPYLGPESEFLLLSFSIPLIYRSANMDGYLAIALAWGLFALSLISLRGLFTWLKKALPLDFCACRRLGRLLVGDSRKEGRYLLFQFFFTLLALTGAFLFFLFSGKSPFLLFSGASCLLAVVLSARCLFGFSKDVDHLSEQIRRLHQEGSVSVRPGVFSEDEETLVSLNQQRDEAVKRAVTSERFRVDLIANVSHDLRTPLTSILGYGELLKGEALSPKGEKHLSELNLKAGYMRDLVESLFELTKVSSGAEETKKEPIDLIRLLEQTIGLFDDKLKENQLQIRRHYEKDSLSVITDGARMHQVFANLVGNAIKYTPPGSRIHLEVKDNGEDYTVRMINIASYEMDFDAEEIVQRFARGDKARTTKGSGLGLAIAQTYTESVGGSFRVQVDGEQFSAIVTLPKN